MKEKDPMNAGASINSLLMMMMAQPGDWCRPTPDEMVDARRWVAAKFEGTDKIKPPEFGLIVLANNDPVQKNAWAGLPLRIGKTLYRRGLFCHAVSKVVVRLPGPGKAFSATVGVDSNVQTRPGRGSIIFAVRVGDKVACHSDVMREGMPAVPINVDLGGATEFVLEVDDADDGIACDQADWADARVTLADGHTIWLADLPVLEGQQVKRYSGDPPFSFVYGGKPSAELLQRWKPNRSRKKLDDKRTEHTIVYTDPDTGLVVRCAAVEYHDFPTVEWTLHFKNTGSTDTPILSDVQALDTRLERYPVRPVGEAQLCEFALHHQTGSVCKPCDYQPFRTSLGAKADKRITTYGGRPTNSDLPYFNIEWLSEGVIAVVGWPGQWAARFTRDDGVGLRVRAGQELTHFKLRPGEEVRSPMIVLQFWKGDRVRSQNVWRRWMLAHNLPRPGGKLPPVQMAACSSHQYGEMIHANKKNQIMFVDRYLTERLGLDYWWMDAGWYWNKTGWPNTGTWEVDTKRFPGGLRAITDHAHAKGLKIIVWFEPERVTPGTWLYENHPEWLLGRDGQQKLLNLGNPDARKWLTDHVDKLLNEQGIDLYRQDFNIDPLGYWRANDAKDRQGITEIRHVEGYLAYWDELRRRHPNMLIDSCASGGRRNDLETLRRAVPLLRSDYIIEPVGNQCHTYGIAFWMPYYGTGSGAMDAYGLRSVMCPHFTACWDMRRKDLEFDEVRRIMGQWRQFARCFFGDYYPLTSYTLDNDDWIAWQFDRPDLGEGMVQVFRRSDSIYEAVRFKLRGLDPDARYRITNLDAPDPIEMTGREMMTKGVRIDTTEQPAAMVLTYKRSDPQTHPKRGHTRSIGR